MSDLPYMPIQSELSTELVALAKAKLSRLVAECFVEPSPAWRERLVQIAVRAEALDAAAALNLSPEAVASVFDSILSAEDWVEAHNRLFGHTVRAACPPYEIEYLHAEVFQQSQTLADIAGFYSAFGFEIRGPLAERADHLVTQWEFLAALAMKESIACAADDDDAIACCRDAQRAFFAEHVARWMPAFCERVRRTDSAGEGSSCYTAVVDLADALLRRWCDDLGVDLGPRWIELRPDSEEDAVITCGGDAGMVELGPTLAAAMDDRS